MGLPSVLIQFKSRAATAISEGETAILALIFKDSSVSSGVTVAEITDVTEIPDTLSATNQAYLEQAFLGPYVPKMVKSVALPAAATEYDDALDYLETTEFNFLAIPAIATGDVSTISSWVISMRDTKERKIMAVLPSSASDHEGIINFCIEDATSPTPVAKEITVGSSAYDASEYCARIAGLLAGIPLTVAPTFRKLSEITAVPYLTKAQVGAKIDAGKLVFWHDGRLAAVKIARGVTSLVTTTTDKGADWKKIKLVRILDKVYTDIKETIEDEYIGSVQNSYENKLLLIGAIKAYFETSEGNGILDVGENTIDIDLAAQKTYLLSIGEDTAAMTNQQIREANTRDQVFLTSTVRPLDAIEDVTLKINL